MRGILIQTVRISPIFFGAEGFGLLRLSAALGWGWMNWAVGYHETVSMDHYQP